MKIAFSSNISWSIYNFRLSLLSSLKDDGHTIYTISARDEYADKLVSAGFSFEEVRLNNNSKNPLKDMNLLYQYYRLYKSIRPDIICHNAIKPNIYGTIAAKFLGIPVVNNISGLGTLFIKRTLSTKIAKLLYRVSQKRADKVFFQNSEDYQEFVRNNLVNEGCCAVIPGSGVSTSKFSPSIIVNSNRHKFSFLFVGRLLFDKGILEYINAIKIIRSKYSFVTFDVLGPLYMNNSTAVDQETLDSWVSEGIINYLGNTDTVQRYMEKADCIVLPSYREGLSKVLIEASSMGIPIVTTDVPGCRDVVVDSETGFLCKVRSSVDLANKLEKMLLLSNEERKSMGLNARKRAVAFFDESIIINHYKEVIYSFL